MAEPVRIDVHICQLLPQQNGLNRGNIRDISKDVEVKKYRFREDTLIRIITSLFIQAVGIDQARLVASRETFPLKDHPSFYRVFCEEITLISEITNIVTHNGNPLCDSGLQRELCGGALEVSTTSKRMLQWATRGVWAMSYPFYRLRQVMVTPPEVLEIARTYEKEVNRLANFLYDQLSDNPTPLDYTSFPLLNLYHSIALLSPDGPITWGALVHTYRDSIPDEHQRAQTLLATYPFPSLQALLPTGCPIPCRLDAPHQSFQEFVLTITIDGMERFLRISISNQAFGILFEQFKANEAFRRNFSLFMKNPNERLRDFEDQPYYSEQEMNTCLAYRMTFHLAHYHIPAEERDALEAEVLFDWALKSDRKEVMSIDHADYAASDPINYCHPAAVVPMVESLSRLYVRNGEIFEVHAFSLTLLLVGIRDKAEAFVSFLVRCHDFGPMAITTHKLLQYSHFNEALELDDDLHFLEGMQKAAPRGLQGSSTKGFDLFLMKTDLPVSQRLDMIEVFNERLRIPPDEAIDPDLYFEALGYFFTGRISELHIHMFDLYSDDYPHMKVNRKLDLLIRATVRDAQSKIVYKPESDQLDEEASDPPYLFKALKLADPKKEEMLGIVVELFEGRVARRRVSRDTMKSFRTHFLSPIQGRPSEEHIAYVIDRIDYLGHDFSEAHRLRLFYEFLSLEARQDQIHYNIEFIKLIESFTSTKQKLAPSVVARFLAYHPNLSVEKLRQLQFHMQQLIVHRAHCLDRTNLEAAVLPVEALDGIRGRTAEIQSLLGDPDRELELMKEGRMSMMLTAPLLTYIYFASTPLAIRHVTSILPTEAPCRDSPNQGLMPLDIHQDLGKQFYGSWEESDEKCCFRFSVVTKNEKISYSGKAVLPLAPAILRGNAGLLLLLKRFIYFLGYDGTFSKKGVDVGRVEGFLSYPKVAKEWREFAPTVGDKETIGQALFQFCQELRIGLRKAFLYLATNSKYQHIELSSDRMDPLYLLRTAACGDLHSRGISHLLVPYDLVRGSRSELTCYGTYHETQYLLERQNSRVDNALKRYSVQERHDFSLNILVNSTGQLLPLGIDGKPQDIDYKDREYKEIDGEHDAYKTSGYALTLSTVVDETPLSVRVIYTSYDLYDTNSFRLALSWHIGQLKARVYERIYEKTISSSVLS